jgi:hypothetical protein
MRAGMEYLLAILRGRAADSVGGGAVSGVGDDAEWDAALTLAEEERLLPWAAACALSQGVRVTPRIADRLGRIERDSAIAAFYWCSELRGVLRAFGQKSIVVVSLKGPSLGERLYGSAKLRTSRDLDLLVAKGDVARAEEVLGGAGFVAGMADDYHQQWSREGTTVELHFDVENPLAFDFRVESALRRVRRTIFQGERSWQLATEDELLYLCLHAVRHRFERLSLVVDLQLGYERVIADADGWHPRPEVAELDPLLTLGLAMARRLQPELEVDAQWGGWTRPHAHLEGVADRLWERLMTRPSEPLDWGSLHAFYVEMEATRWGRLRRRYRHMKILAGRTIEPDYAFAERFGLRRRWQARMLRPVRLVWERVRR